jgi:hypothetical protein
MWEPRRLTTLRASTGCYRDSFTLSHSHLWADSLEKMWEPRRVTTLWASTACYRDSFTLSHRHLWADSLEKMWEPRRLTTLWASTACYRDSFPFLIEIYSSIAETDCEEHTSAELYEDIISLKMRHQGKVHTVVTCILITKWKKFPFWKFQVPNLIPIFHWRIRSKGTVQSLRRPL